MVNLVSVCGIGMLDNIAEEIVVDESVWFGKDMFQFFRFSEIKIINDLTFMLNELYIVEEEEVFPIKVSDEFGKRDIRITLGRNQISELEVHLVDIENLIRKGNSRITVVDFEFDDEDLIIRTKEKLREGWMRC